MTPPQSFGERMRKARNDKHLSLVEATYALRSYLPSALWCSVETIRRMESKTSDPAKADPVLVSALAEVYGCKVSDLSTVVADELQTLRELVIRTSRCFAA